MIFKLRIIALIAILLSVFGGAAAQEIETDQRAEFNPPIMIVNTSFLNIRTGPGTQYSILITVVGGTELPVLGSAGDGVWYQVSTIAGIGWLNSEYAIARGDFRNVPRVAAPELDLSDLMMDVPSSDDATRTTAYASGRQWGVSVIVGHPTRTAPTMSASSFANVEPDLTRIFTVLQAVSAEGIVWYQVNIPSIGTVWVEAPKTLMRPFACGNDITAVVMTVDVRPTTGPDGSGTLNGERVVPAGSEAYLIDAFNNFFKIELADGSTGWISQLDTRVREDVASDYCESGGNIATITNNPADGQTTTQTFVPRSPAWVIVNTGYLNIRSGPGSQYTVVATVPGGTRLDVIGFAPDGVWYLVRGTFGQGWLNSEFAVFRGNGRGLPVIRDAVGMLARPMANITNAITLYAAPNPGSGVIGVVSGPLETNVVARTTDGSWVQLNTPIGFGWVQANFVSIAGDLTLVPAVGG